MSTNGTNVPAGNEISLIIKWSPSTGQVSATFPQIDHTIIFGLLEMGKQILSEMRSKADQRISIPDMQVTKRLIT
jgi:hypothetical protein